MPQSPPAAAGSRVVPRGRRLPLGRISLGIAAVVALVMLGRRAGAYVPQFALWVDRLGVWGPIVFIVGYAAATGAFVPGSTFTLAGRAAFRLWQGIVSFFA